MQTESVADVMLTGSSDANACILLSHFFCVRCNSKIHEKDITNNINFCFSNLFSQIPIGAKETFHLKIEQENRFYRSKFYLAPSANNSDWSNVLINNGVMLELAYKSITFGATFLTNKDGYGVLSSRINCDFGYEFGLTRSLKIQPFVGFELDNYGAGMSSGAKLNKNFDLFDFISLGAFVGCRYSRLKDYSQVQTYPSANWQYISASIGVYCLIYGYERPEIRRDW